MTGVVEATSGEWCVEALSEVSAIRRDMRGGALIRPGQICHVIPRFVGQEWFIQSPVERREYLIALGLALRRTDWSCLGYAIMSNHIHLAFRAGTVTLREWLRPPHTHFANWVNARRKRIGAVFVRGPNVIDVLPDGTARLLNYVHRNPVRAGVADHPSDSDWTSYRAYAGLARVPEWLDVEGGLQLAKTTAVQFGEWDDITATTREELDIYQVHRRREPGRPRLDAECVDAEGDRVLRALAESAQGVLVPANARDVQKLSRT